LESKPTPSLSPKLCKFFGFASPPITFLALVKVFIFMERIELDSESATYNSMWFYEIKPIVSPLG